MPDTRSMTTGMADPRLQIFHCLFADSKTQSVFLFMVLFAIITNSFEFSYLQCVHTGVSPTLFHETRSLCLATSLCSIKCVIDITCPMNVWLCMGYEPQPGSHPIITEFHVMSITAVMAGSSSKPFLVPKP